MVDESLIQNTIRAKALTKATTRRLINMVDSAHEGGADAVVVTCSSIGPAVAISRKLFDFPVVRVDEAMAEEAVRAGRRIGVAATLRTTLEPTVALLREKALAAGREVVVVESLCEDAFAAVLSGDTCTHDRLLSDSLMRLRTSVHVVVLAQASMARVVASLPIGNGHVPILEPGTGGEASPVAPISQPTGNRQLRLCGVPCASLHHQQVFAGQDDFAALVGHLAKFYDHAVAGRFRTVFPLLDGDGDVNGVADEDGADEAEAVVTVGEGFGVDMAGGHADCHAEDEGPVGDTLAEGLRAAPLGIHVVRVKVAGLACVDHDVGFGDGAAERLPHSAECVVFKVKRFDHSVFPRRSCASASSASSGRLVPMAATTRASIAAAMRDHSATRGNSRVPA